MKSPKRIPTKRINGKITAQIHSRNKMMISFADARLADAGFQPYFLDAMATMIIIIIIINRPT